MHKQIAISKIAAFPGSFDPIHIGHINVIKRAAKLFDKLYVVVSYNHLKKERTALLKRYQLAKQTIDKLDLKNVEVIFNKKEWTIKFVKKYYCQYIVRSIRDAKDYQYELNIAKVHHMLDESIETILFIADNKWEGVSSTYISEIDKKIKKLGKK